MFLAPLSKQIKLYESHGGSSFKVGRLSTTRNSTLALPLTRDCPLHSQNLPRIKCCFQPIRKKLSQTFEEHPLPSMIFKSSPAPHFERRSQPPQWPICFGGRFFGTVEPTNQVRQLRGRGGGGRGSFSLVNTSGKGPGFKVEQYNLIGRRDVDNWGKSTFSNRTRLGPQSGGGCSQSESRRAESLLNG